MSPRLVVIAISLAACSAGGDVRDDAWPEAHLEPSSPTVGDTVAFAWDGDPPALADVRWSVGSTELATGVDALGEGFAKGDVLVAEAVRDGEVVRRVQGTVGDAPPQGLGLVVDRPAPRAHLDDVTCAPADTVVDPDGDAMTWSMTWTRLDGDDAGAGPPTRTTWPGDTLTGGMLRMGQRWRCDAVVTADTHTLEVEGPEVEIAPGAVPARGEPQAGGSFTCVLDADGQPWCWGEDGDDRLATPVPGTYVRMDAGLRNVCALRASDLRPVCWGDDLWGVTDPPDVALSDVVVGNSHACGLTTDGTGVCWGRDHDGQSTVPDGTWVGVYVGLDQTCWRGADDSLSCEGSGFGRGSPPPTGVPFVDIALGLRHGCGVHPDGEVECWGESAFGQARPPEGVRFQQLDARVTQTCGLTLGGDLQCWGDVDLEVPGPFTSVSMGLGTHVCARRADGQPFCLLTLFDDGRRGAYGEDVVPTDAMWETLTVGPRMVCGLDATGHAHCFGTWSGFDAPDVELTALTAGADIACGVAADDGLPVCWGWSDGRGNLAATPDVPLTHLAVGKGVACGLDAEGAPVCWGDVTEPAPPGPFATLSAGDDLICGLDDRGRATCWGSDDARELAPTDGFAQIDVDDRQVCGLRAVDGAVICWGLPNIPAGRPGPYVEVSTGDGHVCALDRNGEVDCWGEAVAGVLRPPATVTFSTLDAGNAWHCGLDDAGRVLCWGEIRRHAPPTP